MKLIVLLALISSVCTGCGAIYDPRTFADGQVDNRMVAYMMSDGALKPTHDMGHSSFTYQSGKDQSVSWQRDDKYDHKTGKMIQDFGDFVFGSMTTDQIAGMRKSDNDRYVQMGQQWQQGVTQTVGSLVQLAGLMGGLPTGGGGGAVGEEAAPAVARISADDVAALMATLQAMNSRLDALEADPDPELEPDAAPVDPDGNP